MVPGIILFILVVIAISWKLIQTTQQTSQSTKGLPTYDQTQAESPTGGFLSATEEKQAVSPATDDLEEELQSTSVLGDTIDLDALEKDVGSL